MNKDSNNKYFIILNKYEIVFSCLNNENKISFTKKYILINSQNNLFTDLKNFINFNLIKIEKNLNNFIRRVIIILDTENNLSASLSTRLKFEFEKINEQKINNTLITLKNQFTKSNYDQKIIHMIITQFLIDGRKKDLLSIKEKFKNLIIEVKFECLENQTVILIKKILSNYQISVEKILLANYLRSISKNQSESIIHLANKIINGENINEVLWDSKKPLEKGFFVRFFNIFN
jgi:hypothetical protein